MMGKLLTTIVLTESILHFCGRFSFDIRCIHLLHAESASGELVEGVDPDIAVKEARTVLIQRIFPAILSVFICMHTFSVSLFFPLTHSVGNCCSGTAVSC